MYKNKIQLFLLAVLLIWAVGCDRKEFGVTDGTNNKTTEQNTGNLSKATFAGGCFWGVEHNFGRVPGVVETSVGFMGGDVSNPSYRQVCDTATNHAEVVHLTFDPAQISYEKLVKIFFKLHDPTTLNRQGPDVGTQYRSAIFYHDESQKQTAEAVKASLTAAGAYDTPIVTEIAPAKEFWMAEDYHQQYIEKNPARVCHMVDLDAILEED